jgi:hypothetical protein
MTNTTNSNIEPVTTAQIPVYVADAHRLRLPLFIWGTPGVGKSAAVAQAAEHLDLGFLDIRLAQVDSIDVRGLPHVDPTTNRSRYALPDLLPYADRDGKEGLLFLDEMNLASAATQSAAYQLIHDRKLGDYVLPDGWTVIAAGNDRSHRVHATKMSSALANRFTHLWATTDLDGWSRWAARANVADTIRAFIRNRPELLNTFDPAREETVFATPRSWEKVSKILGAVPRERQWPLIAGTVGAGPAGEFFAFERIVSRMPNPDAVLMDPEGAKLPRLEDENGPALLYALAAAISSRATRNSIDRVVKVVNRMPVEFGVVAMKEALTREPALAATGPAVDWLAENGDVLI